MRVHRAWMIRGYAIGLGAGTQVFTQGGLILATGPLTLSGNTYAMLAGWLVNIGVAEWAIRRIGRRPATTPRPATEPAMH